MLCACSKEQQFQFEEVPESPESLATRDFSVSGLSSGYGGDWESKFDDNQVDDIESTLKETLSLNYEEARALLGRLEYQRGNIDAALQVFQGIDIGGLKPRMVNAIAGRTRPRKAHPKGRILVVNVMSMHSVSLLIEAIFLKSKSLEELGRSKDAALECKNIIDIIESAWPHGMPQTTGEECKLKEIFHKALERLPYLWKQTGNVEEIIAAYRRALIKPWNLDPEKCATFQKDLASTLLFAGEEVALPPQLHQAWGPSTPKTNLEEAILLLLVLMRKIAFHEINWDQVIMDHLTFALSVSGEFEFLAEHFEQILPGIYNRAERWYFLALCYSAAGMDDEALNILRKVSGFSERKNKPHIPSLLLGSKLCSKNRMLASEGIDFARRAIKCEHFMGLSSHFLGVCFGNHARTAISDAERQKLQKDALGALQNSADIEKDDPEVIYSLAFELGMQRNLSAAREMAVKHVELVGGSSLKGWRLLALLVSSHESLKEAEGIVDLAVAETGMEEQLELLRMKALLHVGLEQPKNAIETYRILLAAIQGQKEIHRRGTDLKVRDRLLEIESWTDLASIYKRLGLHRDSSICLDKAKSIGYFSQKTWHETGKILADQSLHNEALLAFSVSLLIEPDYVPSLVSTAEILIAINSKSLPVARSFLMNALRLEPTNHNAWLNLGHVLKTEGSLRQAADCFKAAYELRESSPIMDFL